MTKRNLVLVLRAFFHTECVDPLTQRELAGWASRRSKRLRKLSPEEVVECLWNQGAEISDEEYEEDEDLRRELGDKPGSNRLVVYSTTGDDPKPEQKQILASLFSDIEVGKENGEKKPKNKKKKRKHK